MLGARMPLVSDVSGNGTASQSACSACSGVISPKRGVLKSVRTALLTAGRDDAGSGTIDDALSIGAAYSPSAGPMCWRCRFSSRHCRRAFLRLKIGTDTASEMATAQTNTIAEAAIIAELPWILAFRSGPQPRPAARSPARPLTLVVAEGDLRRP